MIFAEAVIKQAFYEKNSRSPFLVDSDSPLFLWTKNYRKTICVLSSRNNIDLHR